MSFGSVHRIAWDANTEPDVAGYKVYVGRSSTVYDQLGSPINVGNVTSYDLTFPTGGAWYVAVTAYDSSGNESGPSTEVARNFLHLGNFPS